MTGNMMGMSRREWPKTFPGQGTLLRRHGYLHVARETAGRALRAGGGRVEPGAYPRDARDWTLPFRGRRQTRGGGSGALMAWPAVAWREGARGFVRDSAVPWYAGYRLGTADFCTVMRGMGQGVVWVIRCLLYTSDAADE